MQKDRHHLARMVSMKGLTKLLAVKLLGEETPFLVFWGMLQTTRLPTPGMIYTCTSFLSTKNRPGKFVD